MKRSHLTVVSGASPFAVFDRMEIAKLTARSTLDAGAIGRLRPMADEALREICRVHGG
jgi:hypothetical protein